MSKPWILQRCLPRDNFETATVSIGDWLSKHIYNMTSFNAKWMPFLQACALAYPGVEAQGGLREEPRVGFDPAKDQPYFLFKSSANGTTFIVSPTGIGGVEEIAEVQPAAKSFVGLQGKRAEPEEVRRFGEAMIRAAKETEDALVAADRRRLDWLSAEPSHLLQAKLKMLNESILLREAIDGLSAEAVPAPRHCAAQPDPTSVP